MKHFFIQGNVTSCDLDKELADMLYAISETSKRIADKIKPIKDKNL